MTEIQKSYIFKKYDYINNEYDKIYDIFNTEIVKQKFDKQNYTQITKVYNSRNISKLNDDEKYIRDIAYRYLQNSGLQQNINYFIIEYWRYRLFGEKKSHIFDKHKDNYGAIYNEVNTCIFYLRKDKTFRGGELEIYNSNSLLKNMFNNNGEIINTFNNIICFNGDMYHKVTNFEGFGIRDCIVLQFCTN